MANLTFRQGTQVAPTSTSTKGSLLSAIEVDGNLASLNADIQTRLNRSGDTLLGVLDWNTTANVVSASTTNIANVTSNTILVSGSSVINALGTASNGAQRLVLFSGSPTLTHNATSLITPYAADIGVLPGDAAIFVSLGSGNWRCVSYSRDVFLPGTTSQYYRGDKTWVDLASDVRSTLLTGLSLVSSVAVSATDSILIAIGKLQKQITLKQDTLVSGSNIKTINGQSLLGPTNIQVSTAFATTPSNGSRLSLNTQYHLDGNSTSGYVYYLPAASRGDYIEFVDTYGLWDFGSWFVGYDVTGGRVMGLTENMLINRSNLNFKIVYTDATGGWRIV